jgi:phage terminase large subunit
MLREIDIRISPKREYRPLYECPAMRNDLWGGRGRGGSHEATEYALYRLTRPDYCRIAFVRKILNDVRHSLWKDFKDRVEEARERGSELPDSDLRIADHSMEATYWPTGNTINCFGVKAEGGRTAKLKSLAGYNLVIIEECDELTEEEFNKLEDSLRTTKGLEQPMIIRIYNPPGRLHWLWKDYNLIENIVHPPGLEPQTYWKAEPKTTAPVLSIFGNYRDNIKNLATTKIHKWLSYLETDPDYYYTIIEGLISEGQRGRIYKGWKPITDQQFEEVDARSVYAIDFGMMALAQFKAVKENFYGRQLVYDRIGLKELAIRMCTLGINGSDLIIGDSADPVSIGKLRGGWRPEELTAEEIEKYPQLLKGFYIVGAVKGPGSIDYGIRLMKELKWHITEGSEDFWNEYREYKWALDKDKNPTNVPDETTPSHLLDDARYIATARGRLF